MNSKICPLTENCSSLSLFCLFVCLFVYVFIFSRQIDKQLDAVFSKGKPHIKKAAPVVSGEQIKGEQQGKQYFIKSVLNVFQMLVNC